MFAHHRWLSFSEWLYDGLNGRRCCLQCENLGEEFDTLTNFYEKELFSHQLIYFSACYCALLLSSLSCVS